MNFSLNFPLFLCCLSKRILSFNIPVDLFLRTQSNLKEFWTFISQLAFFWELKVILFPHIWGWSPTKRDVLKKDSCFFPIFFSHLLFLNGIENWLEGVNKIFWGFAAILLADIEPRKCTSKSISSVYYCLKAQMSSNKIAAKPPKVLIYLL